MSDVRSAFLARRTSESGQETLMSVSELVFDAESWQVHQGIRKITGLKPVILRIASK